MPIGIREQALGISDHSEEVMTFVLRLMKWIFGHISGALSILLLLYLGIKNEAWEILASDGQVVVDKTMGICLIVIWAVIGALFLLCEYLYKRSLRNRDDEKER